MENNISQEIINNLATKIANLEVQNAALLAENKALFMHLQQTETDEEVTEEEIQNESSE